MSSSRLLGASFRGVPFFVPDRTQSGGRRGTTHEFPQRDKPDADDMGQKARVLRVEGMVLGPDGGNQDSYMPGRDALLRALETPGPGIYIDPWQGRWAVVARTYECKESITEGGLAKFTITFEEEGEARFPRVDIDTRAKVESTAKRLVDASVVAFENSFDLDRLPEFVRADADQVLGQLGDALGIQMRGMQNALGQVGESVPTISDSLAQFSNIAATNGVAAGVTQLFDNLSSAIDGADNKNAVFAAMDSFGGALVPVPNVTPTRVRQSVNRGAIQGLVKTVALAHEARSLTHFVFESADQASVARSGFLGRLDAAQSKAGSPVWGFDDGVFAALGGLKGAVLQDISARSANLPRLRQIETSDAVPAFVLAHRLYGDARRAGEILRRNPNFTHGGKMPSFNGVSVLDA